MPSVLPVRGPVARQDQPRPPRRTWSNAFSAVMGPRTWWRWRMPISRRRRRSQNTTGGTPTSRSTRRTSRCSWRAYSSEGTADDAAADWTLLVDERCRLWAHPGGHGVDHMALHRRGAAVGRFAGACARRKRRGPRRRARGSAEGDLPALCGLRRARVCTGFRPLVGGPARARTASGESTCHVASRSGGWRARAEAFRVVAIRVGAYAEVDPGHTPANGTGHAAFQSTSRSNHRFVRCWRMCGSAQAGMRTSSATPNACWRSAGSTPRRMRRRSCSWQTLACSLLPTRATVAGWPAASRALPGSDSSPSCGKVDGTTGRADAPGKNRTCARV